MHIYTSRLCWVPYITQRAHLPWRCQLLLCLWSSEKREHVAADRIQSCKDLHRKVHCVLSVIINYYFMSNSNVWLQHPWLGHNSSAGLQGGASDTEWPSPGSGFSCHVFLIRSGRLTARRQGIRDEHRIASAEQWQQKFLVSQPALCSEITVQLHGYRCSAGDVLEQN